MNSTVVSPSGVVTVIVVSPSGQPGGTTTVMMLPSLLTMATGSPHMVTVAPVRLVPTIWMVAPGRGAGEHCGDGRVGRAAFAIDVLDRVRVRRPGAVREDQIVGAGRQDWRTQNHEATSADVEHHRPRRPPLALPRR
ncbi:MAG: hypothetical protein IPH81_20720 [Candidatus Microthrix sp.]|nr:hypothetical protein [Candidatus Microthrix sp.]